jgi:hypothetical protein
VGRKKKKVDLKPWCFYCEREFDDETVLIQHQMAKHFKCNECPRKLNNVSGLIVHCETVHKIKMTSVPNSKPNRDRLDIDITGMLGVPEDATRERVRALAGGDDEDGTQMSHLFRYCGFYSENLLN